MLKGFRDFVARGNVIDLAVGVVIGAAFNAVITQLTTSFLKPLIGLIVGDGASGGEFVVRGAHFTYGAFINALITFLLTAAALYFFVVLPVNAWSARRKKGVEDKPAAKPEEVVLLTEIRDALRR